MTPRHTRDTPARNHERLAACHNIRREYLPGLKNPVRFDNPRYCRAVRAYCVSDALFHRAGGDRREALAQLAAARYWRRKERGGLGA
ncbi:MAG: hypothetical protein INH13_25785 [Cupriavidus sp.]|nr:hypothetical protein [Cupriavidus sp.]